MVDAVKRKTLKTVATAGMSLAIVSHLPAAIAASTTPTSTAGLAITHIETVFGQTVLIENRTRLAYRLSSISPATVSVANRVFDLQQLFEDGVLTIEAGSTKALNLKNDGELVSRSDWKTLQSSVPHTDAATVAVNVFVHNPRLPIEQTAFVHYANLA